MSSKTAPINFPIGSPDVLGTLSRPEPTVWVLELKNGQDNRLTEDVCQGVITPALDVVEREWRAERNAALESDSKDKLKGAGALVITGKQDQDKFFSNGFPWETVINTPGWGFIYNNFVPILIRLLQYPIPVIAACNGHTYAAGFGLAMACDYRVLTSGKAWCCMNEVHFGAPFPRSFAAIFTDKVQNPNLVRKVALEGHKFTPTEALAAGLVDHLADGDSLGVLKRAVELGLEVGPRAATGVWGLLKRDIYAETIKKAAEDIRQVMPFEDEALAKARLTKSKL